MEAAGGALSRANRRRRRRNASRHLHRMAQACYGATGEDDTSQVKRQRRW